MALGELRVAVNKRQYFVVLGGPFMECPSNMKGVKMAREIKQACAVDIPTDDFKTPDRKVLYRGLSKAIDLMLAGEPLYVGCMGGKGRTGLFMAVLAKAFGVKKPVEFVRANYYAHAVETPEQMQVREAVHDHAADSPEDQEVPSLVVAPVLEDPAHAGGGAGRGGSGQSGVSGGSEGICSGGSGLEAARHCSGTGGRKVSGATGRSGEELGMKPRSVTMVTVSASNLKRAFRKAHPEVKTAQALYPLWLQFWSRLVLTAKVEQVVPPAGSTESEPMFKEFTDPNAPSQELAEALSDVYGDEADRAKELDSERD